MYSQEMLTFDEIKNDPFIKEHIIWDFEPSDLMEPRCSITEKGKKYRELIKGYIFYIDTLAQKPTLYLMKHTAIDYGVTLAIINEAPDELIAEAIIEMKDRKYFGMYPINSKIKDWIRKEMGINN